MKKHILFILFFCLPFLTVAQNNGNRDNPYWTEIVTEQPEGYTVLENGDVEAMLKSHLRKGWLGLFPW